MRRSGRAAVLGLLLLGGCGVSKDIYQGQVVRTQETEARAADLEARLHVEAARRQALEEEMAQAERQRQATGQTLEKAQARSRDLESQLSRCSERESGLLAELDLCRKARSASETEREALRAEKERLRIALEGDLLSCRTDLEQVSAEARGLADEKGRLEREKREKLDEISRTYENLLEGMKEELEQGRVTITQLRGKLSVNLLDEILFDSGSAVVKAAGHGVLDQVGEALKGLEDKAIVIEGHTDDRAITGELARRFPTNWELSTARATSVVRYLQEAVGVAPERLSAVGFGPYRPLGSNETPEGRAQNRRIEIKLVPIESPLMGSADLASEGDPPDATATPAAPEEGAIASPPASGSPDQSTAAPPAASTP